MQTPEQDRRAAAASTNGWSNALTAGELQLLAQILERLHESLGKLLEAFTTPPGEGGLRLPIDGTLVTRASSLHEGLTQFSKVLSPLSDEGKVAYASICLWDVFRPGQEDDAERWALLDETPLWEIDPEVSPLNGAHCIRETCKDQKGDDGDLSALESIRRDGLGTAVSDLVADYLNILKALLGGKTNTFHLVYTRFASSMLSLKVPKSGKQPCFFPTEDNLLEHAPTGEKDDLRRKLLHLATAHRLAFAALDQDCYIHYIPSLFYVERNMGLGGLILVRYSDEPFSNGFLTGLRTILDSALSKVGVGYLARIMQHHARSAAVAGIMGRNMSHNIGSHVSPRTRLGDVRKRLESLCRGDGGYTESLRAQIVETLRDRLDGYIQKKHDFLAEITTEPLTTTKQAALYKDLVMGFASNTLLIDSIANNESLSYQDLDTPPIVFAVSKHSDTAASFVKDGTWHFTNGEQITAHATDTTGSDGKCSGEDACSQYGVRYTQHHRPYCAGGQRGANPLVYTTSSDLQVALPGPLGEYAFYAFLENYIRNVAKHDGKSLTNDRLRIDLRIVNDPKDATHYDILVSSNASTQTDKVAGLNSQISTPLVATTGERVPSGWGLMEMRVCASLLAGCANFDNEWCDPGKLLKAVVVEVDGQRRFGYHFRMMKPRSVCLISKDQVYQDPDTKANLKLGGCWVFESVAEMSAALGNGQSSGDRYSETCASFDFLVLDCRSPVADCAELLAGADCLHLPAGAPPSWLARLPFRRLLVMPEECNNWRGAGASACAARTFSEQRRFHCVTESLPLEATAAGTNAWCWRNWISRWTEAEKAVVALTFQQDCTASPTRDWRTVATAINNRKELPVQLEVVTKKDIAQPELKRALKGRVCGARHQVLYDRHGKAGDTIMVNGGRQPKANHDAYMVLDKSSGDFQVLFGPDFPDGDGAQWPLPYAMAEAGLLRILVVDERIAQQSMSVLTEEDAESVRQFVLSFFDDPDSPGLRHTYTWHRPLMRWHALFAANIAVCTHAGFGGAPEPLHEASYRQVDGLPFVFTPRLEALVKPEGGLTTTCLLRLGEEPTTLPGQPLNFDVVILHQGFVDRLRRSIFNECQDRTHRWLQMLTREIPFVVVTSGRGMPGSMPGGIRFLPYSLLEGYLGAVWPAKLRMSQTVMSLVRRVSG